MAGAYARARSRRRLPLYRPVPSDRPACLLSVPAYRQPARHAYQTCLERTQYLHRCKHSVKLKRNCENRKTIMDVDTLISKIYSRRAIWDRFCKAHSNRKMLEKSWQDIAREMDEDENAIKRKWKYLRDQFSVELGKVHACRSGSGAEISFTSKWPFFESLLFLKNVVKPRTSPGVLTRFVNARIDESVDGDEVIDLGPDIHDIKADYSPASSHSTLATSPEQSIMSQIQSTPPPKKMKMSHKGQFQKSMLNIEKEKLKYLQKAAERRRDDIDEDEMFFSSLLPHVRKIPPSKKMSFRTKIQKIVDEFAYRQQSSPSPSLRSWDSYTNAEQSQNE